MISPRSLTGVSTADLAPSTIFFLPDRMSAHVRRRTLSGRALCHTASPFPNRSRKIDSICALIPISGTSTKRPFAGSSRLFHQAKVNFGFPAPGHPVQDEGLETGIIYEGTYFIEGGTLVPGQFQNTGVGEYSRFVTESALRKDRARTGRIA